MKSDKILLGHGSGGSLSHDLINDVFIKHFDNEILRQQGDAAILNSSESIAFTTDSYVVNPIFFTGGNIGKLAIDGTVNDLAVTGALPQYISVSFIIEEGLLMSELEEIVKTMAHEAKAANVKIVTGDTKVVDKGKCDKIFINTTGVGFIKPENKIISTGQNIKPGDKILINGTVGDHGMTIMAERNDLNIRAQIGSDSTPLNHMIKDVLDCSPNVKFMRDATRGGIATVLTEISENKSFGIEINESQVPVKETVRGICELLGFDPFYVANEGKVLIVVSPEDTEKVLMTMKSHNCGVDSSIIGEVVDNHPGKGWINTEIGGKRIMDMLSGEQLPRIC